MHDWVHGSIVDMAAHTRICLQMVL